MDFFPNWGRPYYYYSPNRYVDPRYREKREAERRQNPNEPSNQKYENQQIHKRIDTYSKDCDTSDESVFEIFGIRLHFDDILIIALIFFLYNEGVRDNLLFISLILILLS